MTSGISANHTTSADYVAAAMRLPHLPLNLTFAKRAKPVDDGKSTFFQGGPRGINRDPSPEEPAGGAHPVPQAHQVRQCIIDHARGMPSPCPRLSTMPGQGGGLLDHAKPFRQFWSVRLFRGRVAAVCQRQDIAIPLTRSLLALRRYISNQRRCLRPGNLSIVT